MGINYYSVLNLKRHCTEDDVHDGFGKLVSTYAVAEQARDGHLVGLCEAYEVLSDPFRRALYEEYGEEGVKKGVQSGDLIVRPWAYHGDVTVTYRAYCTRANPITNMYARYAGLVPTATGDDGSEKKRFANVVESSLGLTLHEVFYGTTKTVRGRRSSYANGGPISVNVPRGFPAGGVIRTAVPGTGPEAAKTLYVFTAEDVPHKVFKRDNMDLTMVVNVTFEQALNGLQLTVKTVDHKVLRVNVTQIAQDYVKTVHGYGMPNVDDPTQRGRLFVKFVVDYPLYVPVEYGETLPCENRLAKAANARPSQRRTTTTGPAKPIRR